MFSRKIGVAVRLSVWVMLALLGTVASGHAQTRERIRIPVGRAEVVTSTEDVRTVAIAEPKIADAAVGSARTVVVNAKAPGTTTLVVYNETAKYKMYDVEVYVPNGAKQVALHVRIAEINDQAKRELGFDWYGEGSSTVPWLDGFLQGGLLTSKNGSAAGTGPLPNPGAGLIPGPTTDGFLGYIRTPGNMALATTWKALEEKGDLRLLANPTLVAKSGEKANFLVGGELGIPIAQGGSGSVVSYTIEWKEFGVRLNFTPIVEEDNSITLKVAPEVSAIDFSSTIVLQATVVPTIISRKASTTVNVKSGEHLILGGLKQTDKLKNVRRVPVLGWIPVLGFLFSNTRVESVERELLVVVSPEVIEAQAALPELPTDRPESK